MKTQILMLAALPVLSASSAFATDYYVSPSGNDTNSGLSAAAPWKSLSRASRATLLPGDHLYLQGGQTFSGKLTLDQTDAGDATLPVLVSSYGTGRAKILAGSGDALMIYNTSGVKISRLIVEGAGPSLNYRNKGIFVFTDLTGDVKLPYISITEVDASGFSDSGIAVMAKNGRSGFKNVTISNSKVHGNGYTGINISGTFLTTQSGYNHQNLAVRNVVANDNLGIYGHTSHTGSGIILAQVETAAIEKCIAYNNGSNNTATAGGPVGIWTWDSNRVTIQYNESYNNRSGTAVDGGGFDLDGGVTNSVMQYNYSHGNDGAGYLLAQFGGARPFSNNIVRYNVSENDGRKNSYGGIYAWSAAPLTMSSVEIYNNTIYMTSATNGSPSAINLISATKDFHFRNNILVTRSGKALIKAKSGQVGLLFQGNNYWSSGSAFLISWMGTNYSSLTSWRTATGQEKLAGSNVGYSVDPRLTAPGAGGTYNSSVKLLGMTAYRLQEDSPMIDRGLNLVTKVGLASPLHPGAKDFFGSALPQGAGFDIGAHERTPTPLPVSSPSPVPVNLIANSGFESGMTNWINWENAVASSTSARSGTQALSVGIGKGGANQVVTNILKSGMSYELSAWGKLGASTDAGWIGITFETADGAQISKFEASITASTYTRSVINFTAPASFAKAYVWVWHSAGSSYVYTDDFSLISR